MKQSTKAALLSGLAFPGLGQLIFLKRPKRGLAFLLPSLAATIWLMRGLWQATTALMDEALSGRLAPDPIAMAERLHQSSATSGADAASWIIVICWLASIIDALFIRDKN